MIKNLKRKLAASAAAAVVAVVATAGAAAAVFYTDMVTVTVNPPPGDRRCVDLPTRATMNASVNDAVVSGHKVKFVFLGKPDGATEFIEIANSGPDPVSSFAREITAQTNPSFFPGVFRNCARNPSDKPSADSLTLKVDRQ
jgi:hypothetical protein